MTQDEIIEMAEESGLIVNSRYLMPHDHFLREVEAFANLVAAKEREALAQEQEPVAWEQFYPDIGKPQIAFNAEVVGYVAPQRTWVGLTNNELQPIADEYRILFGGWVEDFARAIEAKLKQKNGYAEEKNNGI